VNVTRYWRRFCKTGGCWGHEINCVRIR